MKNKLKHTEPFIGCTAEYDEADIVLFGVPFDSTTSYRPGARFGGKVIRAESYGLETYSPYLKRDLEELKVFDGGEIELPFGNTEKAMEEIYQTQKLIHTSEKLPVMLGGEHLVTFPAVRAALEKYPDLCIIHFDAHTDLRDMYLGEKLSHACVMRRCHELLGDNRIYSYGIRSGTSEEFEFMKLHNCSVQPTGNIYLTIDLDVLDPSEFPATGTPEAGGISFIELRKSVIDICNSCNIVGADLVEYSPPYDVSGFCAATAGKLLRELLLSI
ncbi:MAG: agmatinase [Oscillospiraceae bacterium]|nr:agmatinase [Oscillospiraceae bacterium]